MVSCSSFFQWHRTFLPHALFASFLALSLALSSYYMWGFYELAFLPLILSWRSPILKSHAFPTCRQGTWHNWNGCLWGCNPARKSVPLQNCCRNAWQIQVKRSHGCLQIAIWWWIIVANVDYQNFILILMNFEELRLIYSEFTFVSLAPIIGHMDIIHFDWYFGSETKFHVPSGPLLEYLNQTLGWL